MHSQSILPDSLNRFRFCQISQILLITLCSLLNCMDTSIHSSRSGQVSTFNISKVECNLSSKKQSTKQHHFLKPYPYSKRNDRHFFSCLLPTFFQPHCSALHAALTATICLPSFTTTETKSWFANGRLPLRKYAKRTNSANTKSSGHHLAR